MVKGMSNTGYIKLHRQIEDCWIWNCEPFSKGQAWIDLLLQANHEDHNTMFNGNVIVIGRGQRMTSIKALSERWMWSRHKVSDFLDTLEKDKMISQKRDNKRTLINIVNYGIYQDNVSESGHQTDIKRTSNGHQKDTNNNDKNENKYKEEYTHALPEKIIEQEADVELIPLADGSGWRPTIPEYEEYQRLFPDTDIDAEFRNMRAWCLANTKKTRNGVKRFVASWLSRAQNSPRAKPKTKRETFDANAYLLSQINGGET